MTGPPAPPKISRRTLVRSGAALAGGLGLGAGWLERANPLGFLAHSPPAGWGWHLDATGDGRIDEADRRLVESALGLQRGKGLDPHPRWDPRADLLGDGAVGPEALEALRQHGLGAPLPVRPMVTCFHYGWYRGTRRRGGHPTLEYRGGNYDSGSRSTEERFNRLKNEFGIGADLLSWIDRPNILRAYERGYMSASNLESRRFGLLFETVINLDGDGSRLHFGGDSDVADRLTATFGRMGRWAARAVTERGARPLLLDDRPVVYLFASHLFGSSNDDLPWVSQAIIRARDAFAEAFGSPPFLIGEESPFPHDAGIGIDRAWRARWMDAVTRYHHYDEQQARQIAPDGSWRLDHEHRARLIANERRALRGFRDTRNELTGRNLLVIPSSAAGFAKRGMPVLEASEEDYLALLEDSQRLTDEHLAARHADTLEDGTLPFPLALVGSWNEEFEGHALLPASYNRAMVDSGRDGFEWLWAIRRLYGWNHYGGRPE